MRRNFTLIRGCSLLKNYRSNQPDTYLLGNIGRVVAVTSSFERSALLQIAEGVDPFPHLSAPISHEVEGFIERLSAAGFLNHTPEEFVAPARNIAAIDSRDAAINQLHARSAPELMQLEWIDGASNGGARALAARSVKPVELSGRSRVISLIYSILLASGASKVRFADRHYRPLATDLDIGFGGINEGQVGALYYQIQEDQRRGLSLFPIDRHTRHQADYSKPIAVIHYGDLDPELYLRWSNERIAHLVIHRGIGDEIVVGPLVIPGESPCNRCFSLYEIDNFGFTRSERLDLTAIDELPAASAHYIASLAASMILHFIDEQQASTPPRLLRSTGVGEVTYINLQKLNEPQVVAIARHPLCGCN